MSLIISGEHSIKFVKKANAWCDTWFEFDKNNKPIQKQAWFFTKPV